MVSHWSCVLKQKRNHRPSWPQDLKIQQDTSGVVMHCQLSGLYVRAHPDGDHGPRLQQKYLRKVCGIDRNLPSPKTIENVISNKHDGRLIILMSGTQSAGIRVGLISWGVRVEVAIPFPFTADQAEASSKEVSGTRSCVLVSQVISCNSAVLLFQRKDTLRFTCLALGQLNVVIEWSWRWCGRWHLTWVWCRNVWLCSVQEEVLDHKWLLCDSVEVKSVLALGQLHFKRLSLIPISVGPVHWDLCLLRKL